MNMPSASPAERAGAAPAAERVLVWDAPLRMFHWLTALCFAGAWLTADSERWRSLHVTLGYTLAGLLVFRVVWGLVGTRNARFTTFLRGPRAAVRYLGSLLRGQPEHHTGHNPAGALAIVAMLGLAAAVTLSGWAAYTDLWPHRLEELHEIAAGALMALVVVHVVAVAVSSILHRENLVGAMINGRKSGAPREAIHNAWHGMAALILAAVLAFWWWQWAAPVDNGPAAGSSATTASRAHGSKSVRHDDD